MFGVEVEIVRYVDNSYPGWVECNLTDAHGRVWLFIEKVPVITDAPLDAESNYPTRGIFACEVIRCDKNIALISTINPWGIESVEGDTEFEVSKDLIVDC